MNTRSLLSIPAAERPSGLAIVWYSVLYDDVLGSSLIAGIFAAILSAIALLTISAEAPFYFRGIDVDGRVLGKQIVARDCSPAIYAGLLAHGGGDRPHHLLDYEFTDADGTSHRGQSAVPSDRWNATSVGDAVKVTYLPDDPKRNRVVGAIAPSLSLQFGLATAACGATYLCLWTLKTGVLHVRTNLDLFQNGEPTWAWISHIENRASRKARPDLMLHYKFDATDPLSGQTQGFTGNCPAAGRRGKTAKQGDQLLVCYDGRKPQRHAVDRYGLFDLNRGI